MAAFARKRVVLNDKGVAVWFVLLIIAFVFLPFMVLTIDMAYVYYTRGQLHNAADAAALAGVSGIDNLNDTVQIEARTRTIFFANKNGAAGSRVLLNSNNSNTLSDDNDITVGNWDGTAYTPGIIPINAVQAVARRTDEKPNGEFGLMFGFAVGRSVMNIGASAVASLPARAEAPLSLCVDSCNSATFPPDPDGNWILYWPSPASATEPGARVMAWTLFDEDSPSVNENDVLDFICEKKGVAACSRNVYTTHGTLAPSIRAIRCAFKDSSYDTINKVCTGGSTPVCGDEVSDKGYSWTVIVPILQSTNPGTPNCPPSQQGEDEPYEIVQYAEITIIEIYAKSGGKPSCPDCPDYDDYNFPLPPGGDENTMKISAIRCVTCPEASTELLGRTPVLVR